MNELTREETVKSILGRPQFCPMCKTNLTTRGLSAIGTIYYCRVCDYEMVIKVRTEDDEE